MAYCGPHGIPHSHFVGGPQQWTPADRQKALAWQDEQRSVHHVCGTDPDDWDPAKGGDRRAWEFVQTVCPGCVALEQAQAQLQQEQQTDPMKGLHLTRRRPKPRPEEAR